MLEFALVGLLVFFIIAGLRHPAVAYCGYMWADFVAPHKIAGGFSSNIQFSMIMAGVCILSMFMRPEYVKRPGSAALFILLFLFIGWFSITTTWSGHPAAATFKLDWAAKSLGFVLVALLVINSRVTLELFTVVFIICVAYFALQVGIKTVVGGGSYGAQRIHGGNNNGLTESSTLGGVAVSCLPLLVYLWKHNVLLGRSQAVRFILISTGILFIVAVIGTHSRTGLVCLFILAVSSVVFVQRRFLFISIGLIGAFLTWQFVGQEWIDRMSTISNSEDDSSALGRVVVWKWTLDYVSERPFGGGFDAYRDNAGQLGSYIPDTTSVIINSDLPKAFHSVYFEVLGEQGWPGLILYLAMMLVILRSLFRVRSNINSHVHVAPEFAWISPAATAYLLSFVCLLVSAIFIGVAYRPYLFIAGVAAGALVYQRRVEGKLSAARDGSDLLLSSPNVCK